MCEDDQGFGLPVGQQLLVGGIDEAGPGHDGVDAPRSGRLERLLDGAQGSGCLFVWWRAAASKLGRCSITATPESKGGKGSSYSSKLLKERKISPSSDE
jgi:hypothetical protein